MNRVCTYRIRYEVKKRGATEHLGRESQPRFPLSRANRFWGCDSHMQVYGLALRAAAVRVRAVSSFLIYFFSFAFCICASSAIIVVCCLSGTKNRKRGLCMSSPHLPSPHPMNHHHLPYLPAAVSFPAQSAFFFPFPFSLFPFPPARSSHVFSLTRQIERCCRRYTHF